MMNKLNKNYLFFLISFVIGLVLWFLPPPEGVSVQAIHMFAIFMFTVVGIILKPAPIGTIAFIGLTLTVCTRTLPFEQAFSGFNNHIVWLVVIAFFISRGFIKTGLGERIAFFVIKILGKNTLGMGYGILLTDFILAPAIPSVTARVGGILYPIVTSLARVFDSEPHRHPRKLGAFLVKVTFQGSIVTSAMFLTSMAGNPLIADLAGGEGIHITWGKWALAAILPGLLSLLIIPFFLYKVYPPEIRETPNAKDLAKRKLAEMGPITLHEWILIGSFLFLITLWIIGPFIQFKAVVTALIGLVILLLTSVLSWEDVTQEKGAWNTLMWFAILIMMAGSLQKLGLTSWFSSLVQGHVQNFAWLPAFLILALIYFYSHYFFASNVAHIGSMYAPFLVLSIALGVPPLLSALILGFFSNLMGGLTHYGCGPAAIYFASGYVKVSEWWKLGFCISVINILIWLGLGSLWLHLVGYF